MITARNSKELKKGHPESTEKYKEAELKENTEKTKIPERRGKEDIKINNGNRSGRRIYIFKGINIGSQRGVGQFSCKYWEISEHIFWKNSEQIKESVNGRFEKIFKKV